MGEAASPLLLSAGEGDCELPVGYGPHSTDSPTGTCGGSPDRTLRECQTRSSPIPKPT